MSDITTTEVPRYLTELRDLIDEPDLALEEVEAAIDEASSAYNYFLQLYLNGQIQDMAEAWRLVALRMGQDPVDRTYDAGVEMIAHLRKDPDIVCTDIDHPSSVSDLQHLYSEICYDPTGRNMPIVVVQHGGSPGSRFGTVPTCFRMAQKGMFAISVSKRGRDGSDGTTDSFAVETFDIIDAIEYVKANYAEYVDPANVNIWGFSGGCIDSAACAVRFPDYFRIIAPHFGQLEWTRTFAALPKRHAAADEQSKIDSIASGVGGWPDEVPDKWLARDLLEGVVNNPYSKIHLVIDALDPSGPLLQEHFDTYLEKAQSLGHTNVELHRSQPGDIYRFHHLYPGPWPELGNPDLMAAENFFVPDILAGTWPEPVLADAGRLTVLGYVQTKRFSIWLGEGDDAVADVDYSLAGQTDYFTFTPRSSDPSITGRLTLPNPKGHHYRIEVNGEVVGDRSEPTIVATFHLGDTVVVRRSM